MSYVNINPASTGDILIVDDTPSDLKLLSSILKEAGYQTRPASDGRLALRSVQAKLPALILLDTNMPALDGYEVCSRLKDSEETRDIPVIFITVNSRPQDKLKAFGLGAVDFISKPFDAREVLARIATHLSLWKARKEVEDKNLQLQQEITERKRAEEALYKERDFAESLINTAQTIILVLDTEGRIVRFNPYMEAISGYSLEELKGKDWFSTFLPKQDAANIKKLFSKAVSKIQTSGNVNPIMTKDGRKREIEWYDKILKDAKGNTVGLLAIGQDITARMKAEEMLKTSLREKEVLLQEINHRVKNNMQIVVSLLRLQSYAAKDERIKDMLKVAQNRIRSMAIIHEKLYKSKNFASIDFAHYIQSLATHLMQTYQIDPKQIALKTDVKDVFLDINQGVPVGLLINELVSNALKHAFPKGKKGEISLKFHADKKGEKTLIVSDNGIGYPEKVSISKPETLGMQLIRDLTKQIGGKLDLDNKAGTTVKITFS